MDGFSCKYNDGLQSLDLTFFFTKYFEEVFDICKQSELVLIISINYVVHINKTKQFKLNFPKKTLKEIRLLKN